MTQQQAFEIGHMEGRAAIQSEDAFRLVYAEAFAEPPYDETEEDVAAAFRRFPVQAAKPGFLAALARTGTGEPIGMAYGFALPHDAVWWDELTTPVPADMRREDGRRTFALMELAVRGPWRGRGVARRLHTALLDALPAERERVLLNVHPASGAAPAAYRAWGYRKVAEARPLGPGTDLRDVMLLDLRR
ncbi:GNAT family N-acetyltransferase [Streptomyces sp. NPDC059072]|uniref:GNAT family N-acetyltransferase n=1 Tax=unclassified Streptomyces TaxID=2593676 RepID=UPI0036A5C1CE